MSGRGRKGRHRTDRQTRGRREEEQEEEEEEDRVEWRQFATKIPMNEEKRRRIELRRFGMDVRNPVAVQALSLSFTESEIG